MPRKSSPFLPALLTPLLAIFLARLFGKSPEGLARDPKLGVADEPTQCLQEIAWATVQGFKQPRAKL